MSVKKKLDALQKDTNPTVVDDLVKEQEENTEAVVDEVVTTTDANEDIDIEERSVKATYDATEKLAIASTDVIDRHGERINQDGWDLKNFKKNPVMLWGHNHGEIAVGLCKNIHIEKKNGSPRLVFTPEFHDKTPTAKALKELFAEGWLNSFSVGFMPKEFDGKESTYLKQELLEISAVNVPANPDARMLAYKSLADKGFATEEIKDVMGELSDNEQKKQDALAKEVPVEKGPVSDEVEDIENWEKKHENMSDVRTIWWAFCDTYFDEETPVDDFDKLLKETIALMTATMGEDKSVTEVDEAKEVTEEKEVLDNIETIDNSNDKLSVKTDSQEKTQVNTETSVAPTEKEKRTEKELTKTIAKATDILLSKEDAEHEKMLKIIKRAAEILNSANKGNK